MCSHSPETGLILGCIQSSAGSRAREGTQPLCYDETLLQCYTQLWGPQNKKNLGQLERVQRRPRRCSKDWLTSARDRLRELGMSSLEKRKLLGASSV